LPSEAAEVEEAAPAVVEAAEANRWVSKVAEEVSASREVEVRRWVAV
tara:strand:+ start:24416 stop:24556 length:141 start_codon:yes stop_codon:yes gene_type:complete